MNDTRYTSGTILEQTKKEEAVTRLENDLGDMTDGLFIALKKLSLEQLAELLKLVRERETALRETEAPKTATKTKPPRS